MTTDVADRLHAPSPGLRPPSPADFGELSRAERERVSRKPAAAFGETDLPCTAMYRIGAYTRRSALILLCCSAMQLNTVWGQPGGLAAKSLSRGRAPRTQISVELLTGDEGAGLAAHNWYRVFEGLQIPLTVRRGLTGEKMETVEQGTGAGRRVRVVGRLHKTGRLIFADRAFRQSEAAQLARWLRDLQEYGAQGSPRGQPAWGLTNTQFGVLFAALAKPVKEDVSGKQLTDALVLISPPEQYRLSFSSDANRALEGEPGRTPLRQSVSGVAKGSALAVVLSEFGLGFRPRRLPDGTIDLQVCTAAEAQDLWPVGWPQQATNPKTAPKYFALQKIDLSDATLSEVLAAAPDYAGLPILIDYHGLAAKQIDLSKVKVSHPLRQTTWSIALKQLTFQAKAQANLYIDEAAKPFVWVTPLGTVRKTGTK